MMKADHGQINQLHDINWGALNHASHTPQLMSCNYCVTDKLHIGYRTFMQCLWHNHRVYAIYLMTLVVCDLSGLYYSCSIATQFAKYTCNSDCSLWSMLYKH